MGKNSFTIFETLVSIFILAIIIVGFSKNSNFDNFDEEFMILNEIENSFNTKTYTKNFFKSSKTISIIKNGSIKESIIIDEIKYKDGKIKLVKYKVKK